MRLSLHSDLFCILSSSVTEASPAWQSGLRSGDCILEINEWRISAMDRPEVALGLFLAGAHRLRLGVMRGQHGGTHNQIGVGVF